MRRLTALAFAATLLTSTAALAQDTIVVELSGVSAELAAQLNVDVADLPSTASLSSEFAAEVCGVAVADLQPTCVATTTSTELLTVVEAGISNGHGNSASNPAPGQQEGAAQDAAPGQQDAAQESAPGQVKQN